QGPDSRVDLHIGEGEGDGVAEEHRGRGPAPCRRSGSASQPSQYRHDHRGCAQPDRGEACRIDPPTSERQPGQKRIAREADHRHRSQHREMGACPAQARGPANGHLGLPPTPRVERRKLYRNCEDRNSIGLSEAYSFEGAGISEAWLAPTHKEATMRSISRRGPARSAVPWSGLLVVGVILAASSAAAAPRLEPSTQAFVNGLSGPPLYTLTPDAARAVLTDVQKSVTVPLAKVSSQDRVLKVGPLGKTSIRVLRPAGAKGTLPVIVYMHGGGWILGDKATHDRLVRELAVGTNAVLVFVDYDRSPEAHFPVAIEEGYAVLKYVAEHG